MSDFSIFVCPKRNKKINTIVVVTIVQLSRGFCKIILSGLTQKQHPKQYKGKSCSIL